MGYELPQERIVLVFEGEYEGLEIRCRRKVPARTWSAVRRAMAAEENSDEQWDAAMTLFVEGIAESWNFTQNGDEVPLTKETLQELPLELVGKLIPQWAEASGGVPAPLDEASPSGNTSQEEWTPTAIES